MQRTILDSVTAILGDGLHIGVLLQGKKVTDDNKTLHQAGISHGDGLDNLRFLLEPNTRQTPEKLTSVKDPRLLNLGCAPDPLERYVFSRALCEVSLLWLVIVFVFSIITTNLHELPYILINHLTDISIIP